MHAKCGRGSLFVYINIISSQFYQISALEEGTLVTEVLIQLWRYLYEKPPFIMFIATKSRSASSRTMQASFPPNSICRGIMPAFFEIPMPVSPPVKLANHSHKSVEEKLLAHGNWGCVVWYYHSVIQRGANCHLIQFTPGCIVRKSPISEPLPVTQLIRPLGKPAKWKQWIMCRPETAPWNGSLNKH